MSRADDQRAYRRRRAARTGERIVRGRFTTAPRKNRAIGEEPPHGTRARYSWVAGGGCRCDECREAANAYNRARRAARRQSEVPASDEGGA